MSNAEHLAAYADSLMRRVKEKMTLAKAAEEEAAAILVRAKIAIREAKALASATDAS